MASGPRRTLSRALDHPVLTTAAVALLARVVFAVVSFMVNHGSLIPDEAQYIDLASSVARGDGAEAWAPGYGGSLFRATWVFMAPLTVLSKVFGDARLVPQLFVVTWGVLVVAGTVRLTMELGSRRSALIAGTIAALLPSQVLFSSVVLREAMVWFGLVAIAVIVARSPRWRGRQVALAGFAVFALLVGLGFLRSQTLVAAAFALVPAAWIGPRIGRFQRGAVFTLAAAVAPVAAGFGAFGIGLVSNASDNLATTRASLGFDASSRFEQPERLLDEHGDPVHCTGRGQPSAPTAATTAPGAVALAGQQPIHRTTPDGTVVRVVCRTDGFFVIVDDGVGATLSRIPSSVSANLLEPFPWTGGDDWLQRLAAVENVAWYALYVLASVGAVIAFRRTPHAAAFPIFATATILGASIVSQGNLGTAFRHRGEVLWAVAAFAAVGLAWLRGRPAGAR